LRPFPDSSLSRKLFYPTSLLSLSLFPLYKREEMDNGAENTIMTR
jgi:hypothetical protein